MGSDGGYIPKRGDIISIKSTLKKKYLMNKKIKSSYWNILGESFNEFKEGLIKLNANFVQGRIICAITGIPIKKPAFSFPCGCVFEFEISEIMEETCPICDKKFEKFVKINS